MARKRAIEPVGFWHVVGHDLSSNGHNMAKLQMSSFISWLIEANRRLCVSDHPPRYNAKMVSYESASLKAYNQNQEESVESPLLDILSSLNPL